MRKCSRWSKALRLDTENDKNLRCIGNHQFQFDWLLLCNWIEGLVASKLVILNNKLLS